MDRYNPASKDSMWRSLAKAKADYTCIVCGKRHSPYRLHAHHIESYADNPDKRTDINNSAVMCEKCHIQLHDKFGYGNNNREQFEQFLKDNKKEPEKKPLKIRKFKIKNAKT